MTRPKTIGELALFGGTPAFASPRHVGLPNFGDEAAFMRRIERILRSRRFTNDGPLVRELETRMSELTGVAHAIATCNATVALQILAHALALKGGVIVPAFTFIATAHAFRWVGLEPVFCDIDPVTHGLDPRAVEEAIRPECSAIVAVRTWGIAPDYEALEGVARRHNLPLIIDSAHAVGCSDARGPAGSAGSAEVFSLHATKIVNSFEGGVITTNDPNLALSVRRMRDFGFTGYDRVEGLGTNGRMSEVHAAAGLTALDRLPELIGANRGAYERYYDCLQGMRGVRLVDVAVRGQSNFQYVVLEIDRAAAVSRDAILDALHAEGVLARRYFHPGCHRSEPYSSRPTIPSLPVSERVGEQTVVLPTGPTMDEESITTIAELLAVILENAEEFGVRHAAAGRSGR